MQPETTELSVFNPNVSLYRRPALPKEIHQHLVHKAYIYLHISQTGCSDYCCMCVLMEPTFITNRLLLFGVVANCLHQYPKFGPAVY